jgi:hypothetical protein
LRGLLEVNQELQWIRDIKREAFLESRVGVRIRVRCLMVNQRLKHGVSVISFANEAECEQRESEHPNGVK